MATSRDATDARAPTAPASKPSADAAGRNPDEVTPASRVRWPRWVAVGALVVVVGVAAAFGTRFGSDPSVVDSPLIGRPAPDFTLPFLEKDGEVSLAELEGQVVVINFWASWCVACKEEHPDLMAASSRHEDQGVRFLGIVYQDQEDAAVSALDEMGRGYDDLVDPGSATAIDYGVFGVPETFFIDREGTVVAKIVGRSDLELLSRTIETILEGGTPESVKRGGRQSQPGG